MQIGLRVLKITSGIQSLLRPSRRDSQANVVILQTFRLHVEYQPLTESEVITASTGKQNTNKISMLGIPGERGNG